MLKAVLVRMQKEKMNSLLETEGILHVTRRIVTAAEDSASSCSALAERAEIGNAEFGYVAREISKQNIKDAAFCFFYFLFFFWLVKYRREEIH